MCVIHVILRHRFQTIVSAQSTRSRAAFPRDPQHGFHGIVSSLWKSLADAPADNPRGLWAPTFSSEGSNREIVDAENPRCPAFEVREGAELARDRAFDVAQQRLGKLLSPARPHGGSALALGR